MGKIIKDACILFAITLVAGILLGVVYQVTKNPIEVQNEKKQQSAYKAVLEDASEFVEIDNSADVIAKVNEKLAADSTLAKDSISGIVAGKSSSGETVGYVVTVIAGGGYGGKITFSVGIKADGEYSATSILDISETPGLGMRVKEKPDFLNQFKGITVSSDNLFKVVTDGSGADDSYKIDAVSGSTITSKCVTYGINAAIVAYEYITGK